MLSHIRKTKACGLPEGTQSGQLLTDQDLDGRGLPCAVRNNDSHVADLGHGQVHVFKRGHVLHGVQKVYARRAQDDLAAALQALEGTEHREGELHRLVAQPEVRLLLLVLFHEHGNGVALYSLKGLQLQARERLEPVLEPLDVIHVQVTSGLIKHERIAVHQLSRAQLHLKLTAAGVAHHGQLQFRRTVRAARVSEASALHELLALLLRHRGLPLVDQVASIGRGTNEPAHKTSILMMATGRQCAPSFKRPRAQVFAPKWQRTQNMYAC